jgi:tetratricopeptide (TPR) repeat protein
MITRNFFSVLLLIITVSFISCGPGHKTEEQYLNDAKAQEEAQKFDEAIATYKEFVKAYPKSDKNIFAYNRIAGIYIDKMKNYQEAINTYNELAAKHPDTKEAKQSLFMVAFIYDENMKDAAKAKEAYKNFLAKYPSDTDPNDKMSESAKMMLQVLESGQSIEDLIKSKIDNQTSGSKDTTKTQIPTPVPKVPQKDNTNKPDETKKKEGTDKKE